ncbi:hypothetical protein JKP88DRAFT_246328 [Tribonema minus]|uniref:Uncharacterized protein n=1 Tax=Tribonema minus TaxID=303371 RepID=A0A835YT61_9STRA|nr:hypothetical protein JKP88DRAFT_246328 [Tribonema minus]
MGDAIRRAGGDSDPDPIADHHPSTLAHYSQVQDGPEASVRHRGTWKQLPDSLQRSHRNHQRPRAAFVRNPQAAAVYDYSSTTIDVYYTTTRYRDCAPGEFSSSSSGFSSGSSTSSRCCSDDSHSFLQGAQRLRGSDAAFKLAQDKQGLIHTEVDLKIALTDSSQSSTSSSSGTGGHPVATAVLAFVLTPVNAISLSIGMGDTVSLTLVTSEGSSDVMTKSRKAKAKPKPILTAQQVDEANQKTANTRKQAKTELHEDNLRNRLFRAFGDAIHTKAGGLPSQVKLLASLMWRTFDVLKGANTGCVAVKQRFHEFSAVTGIVALCMIPVHGGHDEVFKNHATDMATAAKTLNFVQVHIDSRRLMLELQRLGFIGCFDIVQQLCATTVDFSGSDDPSRLRYLLELQELFLADDRRRFYAINSAVYAAFPKLQPEDTNKQARKVMLDQWTVCIDTWDPWWFNAIMDPFSKKAGIPRLRHTFNKDARSEHRKFAALKVTSENMNTDLGSLNHQ